MSRRPALGRPFDPSVPSNRYVLVATPAIGTIAGVIALLRSETLFDSARWGFWAAGAAFLAWALARELHPDRTWVATVASLVAPLGVLAGNPSLFAVAVILLVARAVAGTTGRSMRSPDAVLFSAVGIAAGFNLAAPGVLATGAVGMAFVAVKDRRGRTWAVTVALVYLAAAVVTGFMAEAPASTDAESTMLVIGVAFGLVTLLGPDAVEVGADRKGMTIEPKRVRTARAVALLSASAAVITTDPAATLPAFAALAATALRPR